VRRVVYPSIGCTADFLAPDNRDLAHHENRVLMRGIRQLLMSHFLLFLVRGASPRRVRRLRYAGPSIASNEAEFAAFAVELLFRCIKESDVKLVNFLLPDISLRFCATQPQ